MGEDLTCTECGAPVTRGKSFEIDGKFLCSTCFINCAGENRKLDPKDRERLKKALLEEEARVLPRGMLLEILESGYDRISQRGGSYDEALEQTADEVDRLACLFVSRQILSVLEALQSALLEQEEEIRRKIRKLASL